MVALPGDGQKAGGQLLLFQCSDVKFLDLFAIDEVETDVTPAFLQFVGIDQLLDLFTDNKEKRRR